jgi:hypothetical protein
MTKKAKQLTLKENKINRKRLKQIECIIYSQMIQGETKVPTTPSLKLL